MNFQLSCAIFLTSVCAAQLVRPPVWNFNQPFGGPQHPAFLDGAWMEVGAPNGPSPFPFNSPNAVQPGRPEFASSQPQEYKVLRGVDGTSVFSLPKTKATSTDDDSTVEEILRLFDKLDPIPEQYQSPIFPPTPGFPPLLNQYPFIRSPLGFLPGFPYTLPPGFFPGNPLWSRDYRMFGGTLFPPFFPPIYPLPPVQKRSKSNSPRTIFSYLLGTNGMLPGGKDSKENRVPVRYMTGGQRKRSGDVSKRSNNKKWFQRDKKNKPGEQQRSSKSDRIRFERISPRLRLQ
ncbi:hypothetical protein T265_02253 [Opisthorchis viverrini]|uniref:Uncharacterized protein n=1 Tax=Opisthorchis viverrini TaxID=6198 RepID=A0A074YV01_OPIVI|nr:hypothetical protein T265_02253 [Opisthorchis viverrini]XP_009177725.1 hypothetical protein T265_12240 [Opisthorchis viverrini]KER18528.1 hypothetical protein T265_12240 [Opisthorchis viverrini]KER31479.1 hypothetical protein T265_02253 [Opisthorchis viverrini]